ncbi:hypothetical protein FHR33_007666 [Nonomuraea dietziae]|uniref:Uncharacterized protein n=1 Tax=Nonomuraea dietziae TaxID=65515 RepID=A0A7W5V766_9ACTN|nr:hypothetical protein [Nonomuraea dietziae]
MGVRSACAATISCSDAASYGRAVSFHRSIEAASRSR